MEQYLTQLVQPYLISLVVATGVGLIIGLEREFRKNNFAGIRTFPLVSILGCIVTFLAQSTTWWLLACVLAGFVLLVGVTYYVRSSSGHWGITTEVSLLVAFVLGAMVALNLITEALAAAVIITTLLSLKAPFHTFIARLTTDELYAFIKFIIISLLLLPFLPDRGYGPNGILNPREIGWIVVIVSSLSFSAYLLTKFAGANKGIMYTSLLGGLFSSTAVTWILSSQSRRSKGADASVYAAGIAMASSIMFLRVALLALIFNREVFRLLIVPILLMALAGFAYVFLTHRSMRHKTVASEQALSNPVDLVNALGFGLLYVVIVLLVYYAGAYFGNRGLLVSGVIAGLADVDAITITVAKLKDGPLPVAVAVITLAMISNTCVKLGIALLNGSIALRRKVLLALGGIVLTGITYVVIHWLIT